MASLTIPISEFGLEFEGKSISIREPTGKDLLELNDYMRRDEKAKGFQDSFTISLVLLNKLIVAAPFENNLETLKAQPLKLLVFLNETVEEMIRPPRKSGPTN